MINLLQSTAASLLVHTVPDDPGWAWVKDSAVAIDAPPDSESDPRPEAQWPSDSKRSGICGAVSPRVVTLPGGGFRMYYTQILPRARFPDGANDYDNSTSRILSAFSTNGVAWTPEPGVRLSPQSAGAGEFRVVSSEVVPIGDGSRLRMYFECCTGPQSSTNAIRSAISLDGGLEWKLEPGARMTASGHNYSAPRIVFLSVGRCRMYCYDRGFGIISGLSYDGGLVFHREQGLRIQQNSPYDQCAAFAPEIVQIAGSGYVMYFAGYSTPARAQILRAESEDGLNWQKAEVPVISPGSGGHDAAKCSEMCLIRLPQGEGTNSRYRLFYEACDGTSTNQRGVWRIASATTSAG